MKVLVVGVAVILGIGAIGTGVEYALETKKRGEREREHHRLMRERDQREGAARDAAPAAAEAARFAAAMEARDYATVIAMMAPESVATNGGRKALLEKLASGMGQTLKRAVVFPKQARVGRQAGQDYACVPYRYELDTKDGPMLRYGFYFGRKPVDPVGDEALLRDWTPSKWMWAEGNALAAKNARTFYPGLAALEFPEIRHVRLKDGKLHVEVEGEDGAMAYSEEATARALETQDLQERYEILRPRE